MAKAFKKKGNPTEAIPVATTIEKVGDTEYGVADYMGRKTYFEKDDNGAFSIPSQDSELNPHFFPGYDKKSGTIDNSAAVQRPDILTPGQEKKVGKAFRKEITFNKSMDKAGQYNVGENEMLRNDQDPNNPQFASIGFVPFANNLMPGDESFLASMRDATFAEQNFNQEEIDQNIGNMMRQNGWSYEQAYQSVYGAAPTGAVPEQFAKMQSNRQNAMAGGNQQAQIRALVAYGMPLADATSQITSGTPVNQTVLPAGAGMGMVNGQRQVIMPSEDMNYTPDRFQKSSNYTPKTFKKQTTVGNTTPKTSQSVEYNPEFKIDTNPSKYIASPEQRAEYPDAWRIDGKYAYPQNFFSAKIQNYNSPHAAFSKKSQDRPYKRSPEEENWLANDAVLRGIENGTLEPMKPGGDIYKYYEDGWEWYFNKKTNKRDRSLQAVDGTFK
jgi:hypothetical protein